MTLKSSRWICWWNQQCFFSPHRHSVCFSGCETKPLPYYSTSLKIGTLLCPVSLISFYKGNTFVPKRWLCSAAPLTRHRSDATLQSPLSLSLSGERSVDATPCQVHVLAANSICGDTFRPWECRCTTCPFPRYSRPRLGQLLLSQLRRECVGGGRGDWRS